MRAGGSVGGIAREMSTYYLCSLSLKVPREPQALQISQRGSRGICALSGRYEA